MARGDVLVLGGGVAGLSLALLLARQGHDVTVVERDDVTVGEPLLSPHWTRKGVPHFLQPHAFMPAGRKALRDRLPDVYEALLAAGAQDVNMAAKIRGPLTTEDEDLQYLAVRRPLIEWALRRCVTTESRINVRSRSEVNGICVENNHATGAIVDGQVVAAGIVVDALGRRMRSHEWLSDIPGLREPESSDCGVVYYSRYYRLHEGFELPDGPWLLGPRGDLGHSGFATFPSDNRTFAALLSVPPGRPSSRKLKDPAVFDAVMASIPAMSLWVNPRETSAITDVGTMAGLRNTIREDPSARVAGLFAVGDAYCHSDPVLALGLSFALLHAAALADAFAATSNGDDASLTYRERTEPLMRERFEFATNLDDQRLRMWKGEAIDFTSRGGAAELFAIVAGGFAALQDPAIFRAVSRRNGLLESLRVLDDDVEMQIRIEELFCAAASTPRPPSGPTLGELESLLALAGPSGP